MRRESHPWIPATLWLAGLCPFFFLSYGFANWAAGQRAHVPSLAFGWESHIPFLAWTIVPYWTSDPLYAISLYVCRTRAELRNHALRLLAAQLISVTLFLLIPLQFTATRPETSGFFGWLFDVLMGFDKPYNQAPSLHLSLAANLWAKYDEVLRGGWRWMMRGWLALIGLSTLTTYQHHFIDVPAGVWVGLLCIALFPGGEAARPKARATHVRVGAAYALGAFVFAMLAWWIGGLAWFLLWPAGALAIIAGVYGTARPDFFGKRAGAMPLPVRWLLAPYLAGAWLNSRLWTLGEPPATEIAAGVWLGRAPRRRDREQLGIFSLVDMTAELPIDSKGAAYCSIPVLDHIAPSPAELDAAARAIEQFRYHRPTLVFCALGYSRSAAAVAAWLIDSGRVESVDAAIAFLAARRHRVVLRASHRASLEEWARAMVCK